MLALFIAGLGLLGLAAFNTRQRFREIAVRKVFGAGIQNIFLMLSFDFLKWVLMANIIAWPIAYVLMDKWLQQFAFQIGVKAWIFVVAGLFTIVISLMIILYQVIRVGKINPVNYIRYE